MLLFEGQPSSPWRQTRVTCICSIGLPAVVVAVAVGAERAVVAAVASAAVMVCIVVVVVVIIIMITMLPGAEISFIARRSSNINIIIISAC